MRNIASVTEAYLVLLQNAAQLLPEIHSQFYTASYSVTT